MFSYENLKVYKKAFQANQIVYRFIKGNTSIPTYAKNQLGRAAFSIMLNIAEGSAKFSINDRKNFYVTSRGSAFECASLICLFDQGALESELKEKLYNAFEEISRILFTMIQNLEKKLKNEEVKKKISL
jgi:four helix bundle protein